MTGETEVCTVGEAARRLGISRRTAYRAAHDGSLPVIRVGERYKVPVRKLDRMLGKENVD